MFAALNVAADKQVILLSKTALVEGNTRYAQGGIAAALSEGDTPTAHYDDTIKAGAGKCNEEAVRALVDEGPGHVTRLIELGVPFDRRNGHLSFTVEGAHSNPRVLHAGGDTTGLSINSTLAGHVRSRPLTCIIEQAYAVDLLMAEGKCFGIMMLDENDNPVLIKAGATILATGGAGRIYGRTTNPSEATGDGMAMAIRAGAATSDMEFVQFHPTALDHHQAPGYLISEAVRGEGAVLRNEDGERFMVSYHPLADLAPRDIVARAIHREIYQAEKKVFLDATAFTAPFFEERFPSIHATLKSIGINPARQWIPVAPAAHYMMGGIRSDLQARTGIEGLYACGEAACTGVHGANRLASNSLLEGLVFGFRAARTAVEEYTVPGKCVNAEFSSGATACPDDQEIEDCAKRLHNVMDEHVGITRNAQGLNLALEAISRMARGTPVLKASRAYLEWQNKLLVADAVARGALARRKSCGAHFRTDEQET